ncbi:hypothetical protein BACOVA_01786 [Bacteroides ovatus ATCC 8483]|uniref:Uncharacterized protein n=1 Tax=Bacteroides ovatus (strain ATCC 8483 / DSM 1896 / JCM 5824 / BCRC 10623 / CCUG 4943 / NCTC 11153) TaxID=411476 RepID=A0AAN3A9V1_BACO1|nr:hypothetical protein BACOVA_01786 [Bacteroides ovatus ATCC 8483]
MLIVLGCIAIINSFYNCGTNQNLYVDKLVLVKRVIN